MPDAITQAKSVQTEAEKTVRNWEYGTLAVMGAICIYFFGSNIMDYIVHAADNVTHLLIDIGFVVLMYLLVTNNRLGNLVRYIFRSAVRAVCGTFCNIDPIGIIETYIENRKEDLNKLSHNIAGLTGQARSNEQKLAANKDKLAQAYSELKVARGANNTLEMTVASANISGLESLITQEAASKLKMDELIARTGKLRDICRADVRIQENAIEVRKQKLAESRAINGIMAGARAILQGVQVEDELKTMAEDNVDMQYANSLGNMDEFFDAIKDVTAGSDMANMASVQRALDKLDALEAAKAPKQIAAAPAIDMQLTKSSTGSEVYVPSKGSGYDDLLK